MKFTWGEWLSDYELTKSFRRRRIVKHYQFTDGVLRQTKSMENTQRAEIDEPDLEFRVFYCICALLIEKCEINRANQLDGETQIPMTPLGNRVKGKNTTTKGETIISEYFEI